MNSEPINIFDYLDYRKYLRDVYHERKIANAGFSYRFIAQKVGFRSASFFSQILKGDCNISSSMTARFADFLELKRKDAEFFDALVQFNQAKSEIDQENWRQRVASIRACKIRIMETERVEFYEKWFYPALRELFSFYVWKEDYVALGKMLSPPILAEEAKRGVELLLNLGMIRKDAQGRMLRTENGSYSTGYEAPNETIIRFQQQTIALGSEALNRQDVEAKRISTLTVSLSSRGFKAIEEEMKSFRHKILRIAEKDFGENAVYQINIQAFPLTQISIREKTAVAQRPTQIRNTIRRKKVVDVLIPV